MANPTTNYGFVLPTSTDLVTDLPADFDVALQGVDTRLKALQPGTTLGDLMYASATANTNTRLGIGSTGNVLTVSGGVPVWSAPAGGGKVLQVVSTTYTTATTINTTTYTDTGLSLAITPTLATSKILVFVNQNNYHDRTASSSAIGMRLVRGATTILTNADSSGIEATGATRVTARDTYSLIYLDSPSTTSATTYKMQAALATTANSATSIFQLDSSPSIITLMEIGA